MARLDGLVAIVTGGGQGFGAGIVERFLEENALVVSFDLQKSSSVDAKNCIHFQGDVTSAADWEKVVSSEALAGGVRSHEWPCQTARAFEAFKKHPTIVVNNAGWTYSQKPSSQVTSEEFDKVFDINVKGVFLSYQTLVPIMQANGGGSFISISSTAALRPRPMLTWCQWRRSEGR